MTINFDELLERFHATLATFDDALVRNAVARIGWAMPARPLDPRPLACLRQLDRIVELAPANAQPLARLLAERRGQLRWGQTYSEADFGKTFIDNYGWLEVFGTRGHFVNDEVAAGLLILGPEIVYPDHHHVAEEIYIPLTGGTEWRMAWLTSEAWWITSPASR
ncbi:dimethylsulfonioproprionate lyase family protein, partial [Mesorhizobium sp.]|uniref:dimethylsulfonioproprionate lyase family protein n=1 Tax=Mesorhizobium sp. TaxID=1871066 RepID=UPI0012009503